MKHLTNGYCTLIKDLDFYSLIFKEPVISISSAPFNGGVNLVKMYMNRQVPIDYNHDPVKEIANFLVERGFPREGSLVTITACDLENAFINEFFMDDFFFLLSMTACFSNALSIGGSGLKMPGTVNITVFTDHSLSIAGGLNLFQSIVEAKSQAFNDFGIRDRNTGMPSPGTSTDTTSVLLTHRDGENNYGGRLTDIGKQVSIAVHSGIEEILRCSGE